MRRPTPPACLGPGRGQVAAMAAGAPFERVAAARSIACASRDRCTPYTRAVIILYGIQSILYGIPSVVGSPTWRSCAVPGILDKERIVAPPSFNRWLIPPCALATHLCIGQAYALSVFNLPLTRQLGVTSSIAGDWTLAAAGLDLQHRHRGPRHLRRGLRDLGPAGGAAEVGRRGGRLLGRGLPHRSAGDPHPPTLAGVPGLRHHRRPRPGHRLHHPGLDADQPGSRTGVGCRPGWRSWGSGAAR